MSLCKAVREVLEDLENGSGVSRGQMIQKLIDAGAEQNCHLSDAPLNQIQKLEWFAGQVLDILLKRNVLAIPSLFGGKDKFAPTHLI